MSLVLYNSLSARKENFEPADPEQVKMYNCGPTVYNYNHIGNFRSYMFVDMLRRYLLLRGYGLKHTSNITDIDDKIIDNALKEGKNIREFTAPYINGFYEDLQSLKIQNVEERPLATESIPEMLEMMKELERNHHIYEVDGNVYFRIASFPEYGRLSKLEQVDLMDAAGGRFEADEYDKESARDFALWKAPTRKDEPSWDSPWGKGRPGWHLECSAMIRRIYGKEGLDIHIGGVDLLFPHHENEIAQSCCAYPHDNFSKYWLHNEHLLVDSKKMSKSLGNFFLLRDLIDIEKAKVLVKEKRAPESLIALIEQNKIKRALRYLLISFHYRTKLNFTFDNLHAADSACSRMQSAVWKLLEITGLTEKEITDRVNTGMKNKTPGTGGDFLSEGKTMASAANICFFNHMDDDLNIARGMACVFDLVRDLNLALEKGSLEKTEAQDALLFFHLVNRVIDVISFEPQNEIKHDVDSDLSAWIEGKIKNRAQAKKEKDFAKADAIRDELLEKKIQLKDTPKGTVWEKI